MKHRTMLGCALAVVAALVVARDAGPVAAQQYSLREWLDTSVRLAISVSSRNGSVGLGAALAEIHRLAQQQEYASLLRMRDESARGHAACHLGARPDPSGRLFDIARCASIWPEPEKAPPLEVFEKTFASEVARRGVTALPDVVVSTFEFLEHLQSTQLWPRPYVQTGDDLKLTETAVKTLCDPRITFIDRTRCHTEIVRRHSSLQPDIFVSQTGYRIGFRNTMSRRVAQQIGNSVKRQALLAMSENGGPKITVPERAVTLLIAAVAAASETKSQSARAAVVGVPEPKDLGKHFAALWSSLNTEPSAVELSNRQTNVLMFDKIEDAKVLDFHTWYQGLKDSLGQLAGHDCDLGARAGWHIDAAASLLFPKSVQALLKPQGDTSDLADPKVTGFMLTERHFDGFALLTPPGTTEGKSWHQPGVLGAGAAPLVAVAIYSAPFGDAEEPRARQAWDTFLSPWHLLVVSAPQVDAAALYDREPVGKVTRDTLHANCVGKLWPSCLGQHPRVLVVAPSSHLGDSARKLFAPGKFMLGASTVKLAAPGHAIPVVSPCRVRGGGSTAPKWRAHDQDGASFAAPIVALVLARIIDVAPPQIVALPEAAVWRVLATSNPLVATGGEDPAGRVAFGQVDVGRALLGADAASVGDEQRATVYVRTASDKLEAQSLVVLPYPWTDELKNIARTQDARKQPGIVEYERGVLTYSERVAKDRFDNPRGIDFRSVLRLARRGSHGDLPLFDLYYLNDLSGGAGTLWGVNVKTGVLIGTRDPREVRMPGFCRVDGREFAAAAAGLPPQPACLYTWDGKASSGFEPLDLTTVEDIVLPLLHRDARFVRSIRPTKVQAVAAPTSPWRTAFCKTGPRPPLRPLLETGGKSIESWCGR